MKYVGIDWATKFHDVAVVDEQGAREEGLRVAHDVPGLEQLLGRLAALGHLAQVMAGAERLSCAAQDHHADRRVPGKPVELGLQCRQHRIRQRVQPRRGVHRQGGDRARVLAQEDLLRHPVPPLEWPEPRPTLAGRRGGGKALPAA